MEMLNAGIYSRHSKQQDSLERLSLNVFASEHKVLKLSTFVQMVRYFTKCTVTESHLNIKCKHVVAGILVHTNRSRLCAV